MDLDFLPAFVSICVSTYIEVQLGAQITAEITQDDEEDAIAFWIDLAYDSNTFDESNFDELPADMEDLLQYAEVNVGLVGGGSYMLHVRVLREDLDNIQGVLADYINMDEDELQELAS